MQVWDLPLRLFHWLLVVSIIAAYITGELNGLWLEWHAKVGLFVLGLVIFRILWGFMGTTYVRFATFFPSQQKIRNYFKGHWHGLGHNPLGALSIFAMLSLIFAQVLTGLFAYNDEIEFYGPLASLISESWSRRLTHWHEEIFDILMVVIVMHLIAIVYYLVIRQKNLVRSMITGQAQIPEQITPHPITGGGVVRLIIAVAVAVLVVGLIQFYS